MLVLIISFSRMSTLERFHCQLTVAGEKESSKSKSALPRTCQENKKLKPEALSPRVSSCSGPQHLAGQLLNPPAEPVMGLFPPLVSGLIRSRHLQPDLRGPPRGQPEDPGAPREFAERSRVTCSKQFTESISGRPGGKVILR